jgi:low molecular weight protein-tyrosine phosphatase
VDFSVLFVCTGNICRSPAAELLFRARTAGLPITATSAGTAGLSGHDMDAPSAFALREIGLDPSGHVARRLAPAMIGAADLVLTADSGHRSTVVQSEPLAFRRTFTMREFARLGADLGGLELPPTRAELRARVALVAEQRGWVEPAAPGEDDIGDPFGAGIDVARATVHTLSSAVDGVLAALGLVRSAVADSAYSAETGHTGR